MRSRLWLRVVGRRLRNAHRTAGPVLAFLQVRLATPERLDDDDADDLAEQLLRALGMDAAAARSVAHQPLPVFDAPT